MAGRAREPSRLRPRFGAGAAPIGAPAGKKACGAPAVRSQAPGCKGVWADGRGCRTQTRAGGRAARGGRVSVTTCARNATPFLVHSLHQRRAPHAISHKPVLRVGETPDNMPTTSRRLARAEAIGVYCRLVPSSRFAAHCGRHVHIPRDVSTDRLYRDCSIITESCVCVQVLSFCPVTKRRPQAK
jgi:hypothetical protein